jgi:hypothetical protein
MWDQAIQGRLRGFGTARPVFCNCEVDGRVVQEIGTAVLCEEPGDITVPAETASRGCHHEVAEQRLYRSDRTPGHTQSRDSDFQISRALDRVRDDILGIWIRIAAAIIVTGVGARAAAAARTTTAPNHGTCGGGSGLLWPRCSTSAGNGCAGSAAGRAATIRRVSPLSGMSFLRQDRPLRCRRRQIAFEGSL